MSESQKINISDFEKRRRLSDVYLKLRKRADYDENFEPVNAEARILRKAEENEKLYRLNEKKPVFYKLEEGAEQKMQLDTNFVEAVESSEEYRELLKNPTEFIENLPLVYRGEETHKGLPEGKTIVEIIDEPYDISRVKIVDFAGKKVLVKRVESQKVITSDIEEYQLSKKAFDSDISTPKPLGYIKDKGNTYLFFEYLEGTTSFFEFYLQNERDFLDKGSYFDNVLEKCLTPEEKMEKYTLFVSEFFLDSVFNKIVQLTMQDVLNVDENYINNFKDKMYDDLLRGLKNKDVSKRNFIFVILRNLLDVFNLENVFSLDEEIDYSLKENFSNIFGLILEKIRDNFSNNEEVVTISLVNFKEKIKNYKKEKIDKYLAQYERKKFGAFVSEAYDDFIAGIQEKMKQIGIKHVDIAPRNILIKLDKDGKIETGEDGKPHFYIIDWGNE